MHKKNSELVSIIVPVYNSVEHLSECIDSLLKQDYPNIEIILVDDGSTDDSYLLCKKYALTDQRIKIFQQIHQGSSSARNTGLGFSSGDYIMFCDSDRANASK